MEALQGALVEIILLLLTGIVGALSRKFVQWMNASGLSKKIMAKEESVKVAINAVEQIAINEKGPEKKKMALKFLTTILNENGIKMTAEEMDIMIEGLLNVAEQEAKNAFDATPKKNF